MIGFLWFNAHPAQVFMGDTGSLAIGGALGAVAILLKAEFPAPRSAACSPRKRCRCCCRRDYKCSSGPEGASTPSPSSLPNGAAPSSLREARMGGDEGRHPLLDPRDLLRADRAVHAQGSLIVTAVALFEEWRASGREVAVVGLGQERRRGDAAAPAVTGFPVYASDTGDGPTVRRAGAAPCSAAGAAVDLGGHDLVRIARARGVVVAPGVPPDVPPLAAARAAGLADLRRGGYWVPCPRATLAASGSRARTGRRRRRRSSPIVLVGRGFEAETAGNIGRPLCEVALARNRPDWLALELSSFQLHDAPHLRPGDRCADQPRAQPPRPVPRRRGVLWRQGATVPQREARLGLGEQRRRSRPCRRWWHRCAGAHLRFSIARGAPTAGSIAPEDGCMLGASRSSPASDFRSSATTTSPTRSPRRWWRAAGGMRRRADRGRAAHASAPFPHRVEPVREVDGVLWINDSKSTNITSTVVAIAALDRPSVLLLGGRHKGEPYTRLADRCEERCRAVVAYGEAGPLVMEDLGDACHGACPAGDSTRCSRRRAGWRSPATRCCCRRPARATTCSRTTRSAATASAPPWRRCEAAGRAVRHPGELRWETRLLGMVTAVLVVFGIAATYGAASLVTLKGQNVGIGFAGRQLARGDRGRSPPSSRLAAGLLPLAQAGLAVAVRDGRPPDHPTASIYTRPSRRWSTGHGDGWTSVRSTFSRRSWPGSRS